MNPTNRIYRLNLIVISLFCSFFTISSLSAQITEKVFASSYYMDPEEQGALSLEINNLNFFTNNEFEGTVLKGYSLPGLWIQPKLIYQPLQNIRLEAGLHGLIYHGSTRYPNAVYQGIPDWVADDYQRGIHLRPFFRAQLSLSDKWTLVVGNIYGAANHQLIEPLYNPELNLTADPETGLQVLFDSKRIHFDAWLNWQSFIFKGDTHQEAFTVGLSTRFNLNTTDSPFHFYVPLQGLIQHRGGEIDTITVNSTSTVMNGSVGIGTQWNIKQRALKQINLETHIAGSTEQSGENWPLESGLGSYTRLSADISDFRVKTSYWWNNDFISMNGIPFYGAVSTLEENAVYDKPQMIYFGVEYAKTFGKGYALGVDLDVYHMLSTTINNPETGLRSLNSATSFSVGVYFRMNPSFLLKKF